MDSFSKIAPYLSNPFVLIGFVLLLVFSIQKSLVKSNILPTVSIKESPKIVRLILHYGFIIAIALILFGFGFAAYKVYLSNNSKRILTRLDAEEILQRNRGSIERCIKNDKSLFLNFFFSKSTDGGISIDILAGNEMPLISLCHYKLPSGVYSREKFIRLLDSANVDQETLLEGIGNETGYYFVQGNTEGTSITNNCVIVHPAQLGKKLSIINPDENECIISLLNTDFKNYNDLPSDMPFLHTYITDVGVEQSSPKQQHN